MSEVGVFLPLHCMSEVGVSLPLHCMSEVGVSVIPTLGLIVRNVQPAPLPPPP